MRRTNKRKTLLICVTLAFVLVFSTVCYAATIEAAYNDIKISVNGEIVTPRDANGNVVEPFIYNGTTYLPVRAVSSMLGNDVFWDNSTKTVNISSSNALVDALNEFWILHTVIESAEGSSTLAMNIYTSPTLQTSAQIDSVLSAVSKRQAALADIRSYANLSYPDIKSGYEQCEKMLDATYDNLKAFKNGQRDYDSIKAERENTSEIFKLKAKNGNIIFNLFQQVNE